MDVPTTSVGLHVDQDACRITLRISAGKLAVPQQRYDFMAATFLKGMFWLVGEKVNPLRVHHPYAAPADPTSAAAIARAAASAHARCRRRSRIDPLPRCEVTRLI